jgi:hypothetical protein
MADVERSIVIRLKGDLTPDAFASARAELQKLGLQLDTTRQGGAALANQFKETKGSVDPLTESFARMTAAFSAGNLIDRGIEGLISFGEQAIQTAAHLYDLNKTTGLSIDALQTLGDAAELTGSSLDSTVSAVENLEARLGAGEGGVVNAVAHLGLNFQALRDESPDEMILDIAKALAAIQDPLERAAAAQALFGKGWKDILPAMLELAQQGGDGIAHMSDRTVEDLKRASDAWTGLELFAQKSVGQMLGFFVEFGDGVGSVVDTLTEALFSKLAIVKELPGMVESATAGYLKQMQLLPGPAMTAAQAEKAFADTLKDGDKAREAAAKATEDYENKVQDLADEFSGHKLADQIQLTADAVTKAGGASNLSAEGLAELDKQLVKYVQDGGRLPPVLQDVYIAQGLWAKNLDTTTGSMMKLLATFPTFQLVPKNIAADVDKYLGTQVREDITNLSQTLDYLRDHGMLTSQMLQQIAADAVDLSKKGGTLDANLQDAVITTGAWTDGLIATNKQTLELIKSLPSIALPKPVKDSWSEFMDALSAIEGGFQAMARGGSAAMQEISQAVNSTIGLLKEYDRLQQMPAGSQRDLAIAGTAAGGVGNVVSGIQSGSKGKGALAGAQEGLTIGMYGGPLGMAVGAGVGALAGAIAAAHHNTTQDARSQLAQQLGFNDLSSLYADLQKQGQSALANAGLNIIGRHDEAANTAWMKQVEDFYDTLHQQQTTILNDLSSLDDSFATIGATVPPDLDKVINSLITAGDTKDAQTGIDQLTDAYNTYKKSLDDADTFKQVESDAQSLGLSLDDMNGKFKQGADEDSARTIAAQWAELAPYVNDVNVLADKYLDSLETMVKDQEANGTLIPESMKPILQSLIDQGKLLDDNGDKITDMSTLNFEEDPLQKSLDTLNKTMEDLDTWLTDKLPKSLSDLGATTVSPTVDVGVRYHTEDGGLPGAGLSDDGIPVADAPIRSVVRPGLVRVNPGDIVGMPSRTPGYGASAP